MRLTKSNSISNTSIIHTVTIRTILEYLVVGVVGLLLWKTPVFRWNWFAMIAYGALASIIIGHTPTNRMLLSNIYGILFKKPVKMVVTDHTTTTTLGHGVREVEINPDIETPMFRMADNNVSMVYSVTSGINKWSTDDAYDRQEVRVKNLFNMMEPGERLVLTVKEDNDTGMLQLMDALSNVEDFDQNNKALLRMSEKRRRNLYNAGTSPKAKSVQQYAVLQVKPKNTNRLTQALKKASLVTRPASNPGDIILSAMGLEGGVDGGGS